MFVEMLKAGVFFFFFKTVKHMPLSLQNPDTSFIILTPKKGFFKSQTPFSEIGAIFRVSW